MALNNEKSFLIEKKSSLGFTPTGSGYFDRMRYHKTGIPLSTKFNFSFNSQINPTILPGVDQSIASTVPIYVISEDGDFLLTEDSNNIIL